MRMQLPVGLIVLVLTGCGGGGGGSTPGTSAPPSLGAAVLPGATIAMAKTSGSIDAGAAITVSVTCADPGIAAVAVLVGADWESATAAAVTPSGAGTWDATVTLPTPLPTDGAVLVRVTFSDGNVVESSRDAFRL